MVIVTTAMYVSFFKYMSFIITDIQFVEINKDIERKLSKTYNLDLASEVREKNITCSVNIVVLSTYFSLLQCVN